MINCLFVGLGGFIGAVCRYLISLLPVQSESGFPYKTFLINVAGAFLIGCIATYAGKHPSVNPQLVLFLKVGICGGFTALVYAVLSVVSGVLAVFASQFLLH